MLILKQYYHSLILVFCFERYLWFHTFFSNTILKVSSFWQGILSQTVCYLGHQLKSILSLTWLESFLNRCFALIENGLCCRRSLHCCVLFHLEQGRGACEIDLEGSIPEEVGGYNGKHVFEEPSYLSFAWGWSEAELKHSFNHLCQWSTGYQIQTINLAASNSLLSPSISFQPSFHKTDKPFVQVWIGIRFGISFKIFLCWITF